jgi:hypothetical protein
MDRVRAQLIPDGGLSASSDEFFRCPPYLRAEGTTHTLLLIDKGETRAVAPVIVSPIEGNPDLVDASSPYGYPGFVGSAGAHIDTQLIDWPRRLVSLFIRDRMDFAPLSAARQRSTVQVVDPRRPIQIRQGHRYDTNRNERRGFITTCIPAPASAAEQRQAFLQLYIETMARVGASHRYLLTRDYIDQVLSSPKAWLYLTAAPNGDSAAAGILVASDEWLHYFLSATADAYLKHGAAKNIVMGMVAAARERGMPLNLGGSLVAGDGLDLFKQGFANRTAPFLTSDIIADADAYRSLCAARPLTEFFPAYRAGVRRGPP